MPYLGASQEIKTKPAQNSVRELRGLGISPDILVARSEKTANENVMTKLSLFCGIEPEAIALLPNASTIYKVPLTLEDTGIADVICRRLNLKVKKPDLKDWRKVVKRARTTYNKRVTVGVVAKYLDNTDTYLSVFEALRAAAWWNEVDIKIRWIDADKIKKDKDVEKALAGIDGVLVPGGFGLRGLEGKIRVAQYALKNKIPYFGLCLGLQMAVIAAARNGGLKNASTPEIDPKAKEMVITTMPDQFGKESTGGTLRLGDYPCVIEKDSLSAKLYGTTKIIERHRHRYECNNIYRDQYEKWGIKAVGLSPDGRLVEMIEAIDHPFFVTTQFHPEFLSRPNRPHPLFKGFIRALLS